MFITLIVVLITRTKPHHSTGSGPSFHSSVAGRLFKTNEFEFLVSRIIYNDYLKFIIVVSVSVVDQRKGCTTNKDTTIPRISFVSFIYLPSIEVFDYGLLTTINRPYAVTV